MQEATRSESRAHSDSELFNQIDQAFGVLEVVFDGGDQPVDYRFVDANPAFEAATGIAREEFLSGKTIKQIIPNIEQKWIERYGRVALTGAPEKFEDGSEALGRWYGVYAFRVGGEASRRVAILFTDISRLKEEERERERLAAELEAERSRLRYLFENAPAFVATLRGPDHVFELANAAYLQLVGHRELIGKTVREAVPEAGGQGFFTLLDNVYRTGEPYIADAAAIKLQMKPGEPLEERFLNFVYQPIFEADGSVSGIFVHGVDVTELVEARKSAEAANRSKDEFLATLSHELRTPLNAILGWSKILADPSTPEATKARAIEIIQRNAQVQTELIADVLDVSRIVSGKLRLEVERIELASIVESAIEAVRPAADARNIRLQVILDSKASLISGDRARLHQVIWNLLSNAIKFTQKGGWVRINTWRVESSVEVVVADNGIGISPNVLPHVFERFRQGDSTPTRAHGGLGLGLSIVRHLVEMHGGTVRAESEGEGKGAVFSIRLPLVPVQAAAEETKTVERAAPKKKFLPDCTPQLDHLRVLVVDDDQDGRLMVQTVLESCGAAVTAAGSAAEALEKLQKDRYDVLISDIGMPGEDGYSLIRKVRALPPDQNGSIPASALTAYTRPDDRMKALRSGFQSYLAKPVEPLELITIVSNLADQRPNAQSME